MKVLFEFDDKKFVMDAESAGEIVKLIHARGTEVYEHKTNWRSKEQSYHVYETTPRDLGEMSFKMITDELYGMGKLKGRPQED
tara:strand:+ start:58 stop:306 length:249 start_codon:yes stop_codon:yes gene_type:complete